MPARPPMRVAIYDASITGFEQTEIVSSADRLSLRPTQFQLKQNVRQSSRVLTARGSDVVIANAAPTGGTSVIHAEDVQMNGTWYHVSAWNTATGTAIFIVNLATGVYTELTSAGQASPGVPTHGGDANGKTRRATSTTDVQFMVATTPRRSIAGTIVAPHDVLVIQNFEDVPLIYDPSLSGGFTTDPVKVFEHRPITLPYGAVSFKTMAAWSAFFQVATTVSAAGTKTYTNSTAARYKFQDSSAAPYNSGSNYCAELVCTSAQANDTAAITFGNTTGINFYGEEVSFLVEGSSANVLDAFNFAKIEFSPDNATWYTAYDPTSSLASVAQLPVQTPLDTGGNRYLMTVPLRNIAMTTRTFKYVRFTRTSTSASTYTVRILMIAGAGAGAGFYGQTEFQIAYADAYSFAETGRIPSTGTTGELVKNMGGPSVVTSGSSSAAGTVIPVMSNLLYDYRLFVKNSGTVATITGGLQGVAQCVDVYFRTPQEVTAQPSGSPGKFWTRWNIYTPTISGGGDHQWSMASEWVPAGVVTSVLCVKTEVFGWGSLSNSFTDRYLRDAATPAPSYYNVAMPQARACLAANRRTCCGCIKDTSTNKSYGDFYFSALGFPFRYQSIVDTLPGSTSIDETSGGRDVLDGHQIQKIFASAGSASGSSRVYLVTDQQLSVVGHPAGYGGVPVGGASEWSTVSRLSADGTNEPRSVAEWNGLAMWLNQNGTFVKMSGGGVAPVSLLKWDDIAAGIPASRRGRISATIHDFRYRFGYTPAAGSTNSRIGIWNVITGMLESIDTMAAGSAERLAKATDTSVVGSGQRLLAYGSDNKLYALEEGTSTVAVRLISRELTAEQLKLGAGEALYVDTVELTHDTDSGKTAAVLCTPDYGSAYTYTLNLDAQSGSLQWIQEQSADSGAATPGSRTVYIDYQATVTAGKKLRALWIEIGTQTADARTAA